ncbi:MAG: hypothetical protein A3E87_07080 [Gammaproteobacteria bacterium RIFCSPHIGHO2_12_FULL_35_23]|nr:MAG: hypothetical protein A3E87_07080 [Gammaproteobacteria bacterium RIFCSPHIGHO2_12_FULL_35_23]
MNTWQLKNPLDAILFDCDGTLSQLEGIVALAEQTGQQDYVAKLTEQAMGAQGLTPDLYRKRLDCVRPNLKQVEHLGQLYIDKLSADVFETIQILQQADKKVFILSAGLWPAVALLADYLRVPRIQVFAVPINFTKQGDYQDFDQNSPLCNLFGKKMIAEQIKRNYPRLALVGDGQNDFEAVETVERFIGYGGNFYREKLFNAVNFYIRSTSLSPVLPLCLMKHEIEKLSKVQQAFCLAAEQWIIAGQVKVS